MNDKTAADLFGDGTPPRNTREKILYVALELFLSHGVHAVGVDRIIGEVGVTKTTFYNHFPSKDDLAVEALGLRDQWEFKTLMAELDERAAFQPRKMLMAIFDVMDDWFRHEDFRGCLFINTVSEFPNPKDPVHIAATQHKKRVQAKLEQLAEGAGVADPVGLAAEWTLLMDGAVTHRLVGGDDNAARLARRVAARILEAHTAGPDDAGS